MMFLDGWWLMELLAIVVGDWVMVKMGGTPIWGGVGTTEGDMKVNETEVPQYRPSPLFVVGYCVDSSPIYEEGYAI